ncbi:MAG: hypothetical protein EBR34_16480 [Sphingomonadaceae bacterium]|nr:hypothetical protein [Sphingomonadaceae bacterium]
MRKTFAIAAILALSACSDGTKQELACTGATIQTAAHGDFSQWVLPAFVPGKHLAAGDYAACMPTPVTPWGK